MPRTRKIKLKGGDDTSFKLFKAVEEGNSANVKELIAAGARVSYIDAYGRSSLFIAAGKGYIDIVKMLMENGAYAHINKKDVVGLTPLTVASKNGHMDVVIYLLSKGASIYTGMNDAGTALHFASEMGHVNLVQYILYKFSQPSGREQFLSHLLPERQIDLASYINNKTYEGTSALHKASWKGHVDIVKLLLNNGADPNILSRDNSTPLSEASYGGHTEIVKLLLEKEADVNIASNDGSTPLMGASHNGFIEIVKLLLDKDANVNATDDYGYTALYNASSNRHKTIVELLLGKDAVVTDKIQEEMSSFNPEIRTLLEEAQSKSKVPENPWQGWSTADSEALDVIFDDENAPNYAHCPFCLKYVERSEACMYMKHNCREQGGYYHKKLYDFFKNSEGLVGWCTICGRPSHGHSHHVLSFPEYPSKDLVSKDGRIIQGDPFEKDCSITSGGGGLQEKLARFRRLREFAKELESEMPNIGEYEAMDQLVEEAWKAPMIRKPQLKTIKATKTWNFPHTTFKLPVAPSNTNNEANAPNVLRQEPNASNPDLQPKVYERGENTLFGDEGVKVVQFRHRQENGTINTHTNDRISVGRLELWLKNATKNFGTQNFGYCYMYPACKARLYPSELEGLVSEDLLKAYKKKFNKKNFDAHRGGALANIFVEATNAVCVRPSKKNGRKTRRRRRQGKN